jgi:hypothetical protein
MSNDALIKVPKLTHEKPGMRLEYDGWRDRVSGALRAAHSNQKETRTYKFACSWERGQVAELVEFEIVAKHEHPDNWLKGTAPQNRKDVRDVMRRVATLWRAEKLKEQESLRRNIQNNEAIRIVVQPKLFGGRTTYEAFWFRGAVVLEPKHFRRINCRAGWMEVLPIGDSDREIAQYVAQVYADGGNDELATEAARNGLSLLQIQQVIIAYTEEGPDGRDRLMNDIITARG